MDKQLNESLEVISKHLFNREFEGMDKEQTELVFKDIGEIQHIDEFFKDTLSNDSLRYFNAQTDEERAIIKGAYLRTAYLIKGIINSRLTDS